MEQDHLIQLQQSIDEVADKLCLAVMGEFDFTIDITSQDQSVQKLTMLVNFVLDAARRAILEVKEKNDKLTELDKLKSDFMANISHELRTPLTLILGPLETILSNQSSKLPEDITQNLTRMQRNAVRLYLLVNDVLDFSKLEAGKFMIHEEPVDLNQTISQLVEDAHGLAQERGLSLRFLSVSSCENMLFDRKIIEKIILNLISNALKFTPEGGSIDVKLAKESDVISIQVSDTGTGIPKSQLPFIFERFHQVDSSSTRAHEGTGIGLALINQLVTLMKGEIFVESEEGKGSTFIIRLPAKIVSATDLRPVLPSPSPKIAASKLMLNTKPKKNIQPIIIEGKKPLLLIVDDNPDIQEYISSLLKKSYEIITADNGKLALDAIKQYHPHLILSDVMMPEMDGYQLTTILKESPEFHQIPIILITAKTGSEAVVESLEVGADDYLSKPFSAEELIARTNSSLRHYEDYARNKELSDQMVTLARRSGMADVATSILHNIGNVLNSMNVSLGMIKEKADKTHVKNLYPLTQMIQDNLADLARYLTEDAKGKVVPKYLVALAKEINDEHVKISEEVQRLGTHLKHMEEIVAMQESLSGTSGIAEKLFLPDVINNAIQMCKSSIEKRNIEIEQEVNKNIFVTTDKNKLLQILVNLIQNANDALTLCDYEIENKKISIKLENHPKDNDIMIIINDNGVGIASENITKIFSFGFTTKITGHGFGLHSSALAAKELGGSLYAKSDGLGYGAEFILSLPLTHSTGRFLNETPE